MNMPHEKTMKNRTEALHDGEAYQLLEDVCAVTKPFLDPELLPLAFSDYATKFCCACVAL